MGAGIHAVMQKKIKGRWETIDTDVLYFPSSIAREFNELTEPHRTNGIPDDAHIRMIQSPTGDTHAELGNYFLGEHSLGYITLHQFCNIPTCPTKRVSIEEGDEGETLITIDAPYNSYGEMSELVALQKAFRIMYAFDLTEYRLIIGYDS